MLTYRYQAVDAGGRVVAGEIQASDARSAQQQLAAQGLRVVQLVASASPPTSQPRVASASPPTTATHRYWEHSRVPPHQMTLWLTQLRSMLKAGMSPANALQSLSQRVGHKGLQHAFADMAHDAARGVAISDAMTKYPELFPSFLIGAFRAAEHGGYLPEMIDRLVAYYEQHRVVSRWTKLTRGCLWYAILLLPLIGPFGIGLMWGLAEFQGGGMAEAFRAIGAGVGKAFLRFGLPAMLIMIALMLLLYLIGSLERVSARLRASGLGFFIYADWIRAQALDQYLFHLGKLTHAGVYPATAHMLAAGATPNRALAEALQTVELGRAEGAAHLDAALERSGLFPIEEIMMARTGVQTGELPNVLQTLASWYNQRAAERIQQLPRAFFTLMTLINIVAWGIAILALAWGYYVNAFDAVDKFMGVDK
ncbi:MAG: type II secretion system F family protein [Fimbriimonadales bacterium]|nr:type II secretion system F family protein [Fimbriimonadales bacterium]